MAAGADQTRHIPDARGEIEVVLEYVVRKDKVERLILERRTQAGEEQKTEIGEGALRMFKGIRGGLEPDNLGLGKRAREAPDPGSRSRSPESGQAHSYAREDLANPAFGNRPMLQHVPAGRIVPRTPAEALRFRSR